MASKAEGESRLQRFADLARSKLELAEQDRSEAVQELKKLQDWVTSPRPSFSAAPGTSTASGRHGRAQSRGHAGLALIFFTLTALPYFFDNALILGLAPSSKKVSDIMAITR